MPNNTVTVRVKNKWTYCSFFTYVDESHLERPTFSGFLALLDNYNPNVGQEEGSCSSCDVEESNFLDALMQTRVMQETWTFLRDRGQRFSLESAQFTLAGFALKNVF